MAQPRGSVQHRNHIKRVPRGGCQVCLHPQEMAEAYESHLPDQECPSVLPGRGGTQDKAAR